MKIYYIYFLLYAIYLYPAHYDELILPSLHPFKPQWQYLYNPIHEKYYGAFNQVIAKWQKTIKHIWNNLEHQIGIEIYATVDQINFFLDDERFISVYTNYYKELFAPYLIDEDEYSVDPFIVNFIQNKLHYLGVHSPVKIAMCDHMESGIYAFGSNAYGYHIMLNPNLYTYENILNLHILAEKKTSDFFVQPYSAYQSMRVIEYTNLFHITLAPVASMIIHQSDYFAKMLQIFIYNKKQLSHETQLYGQDYIIFLGLLETCLQANNPLEAAIFIGQSLRLHQEFIELWQEFINDLENCYDETDLAAYYSVIQKVKESNLYQ